MAWLAKWLKRRFGQPQGNKAPNYRRQPIPNFTLEDVNLLVHRDFPDRVDEAKQILNEYSSPNEASSARVRVACLRIADGNLENLRGGVKLAKSDWRDALVVAEYPEYNRRTGPYSKLNHSEIQQIIDRDWKQYQDWLNK